MNKWYSDFERQEIAQRQYKKYTLNDEVKINEDKDLIGYVSEIKNKLSGENTYIVTDIPLPDNPTFDDLAKVGQVTLLYQGSQDVLDWTLNNVPMTARVLVPDNELLY